jgi:ABC-type transport system substrate-binding protein
MIIIVIGIYTYQNKISEKNHNQNLNLVINNPIKSFDSAVAFNDDSLLVMGQSLETLFQYHYLKRPFEVIPLLADGMPKISNNGKVYTIKIKPGIFYHNQDKHLPLNRSVKAQDFIWQIKRLAYTPLGKTGAWLFEGKIKGFNAFSKKVGSDYSKFLSTELSGIRAIDDLTLEITLNRPEPNLLYFLSMTFCSPSPIELIKKFNNDFKNTMIGTGPYFLAKKEEGSYHLKRFKNFHEEFYPSSGDRYANTEELLQASKLRLPFLENIHFRIIPNEEQRWEEFKKKTIDILNVPKKYLVHLANQNSEIYKDFTKDGVKIKHFSRQTTRWLGFNMKDPILGGIKNLNLRKAIAHSIDFEKYVEILTNNTNLQANSIFNPSISGYKPSHRLPYSFDLTKAKEFFKASGHKPGDLTLTYSTRGKLNIHFEEAKFLKASLAQIGIELKVDVLEFSEFLKKGRSGKLQFWTDNWIYDYPDGENLLQLLISRNHPGINKSAYSNISVDDLYDELSKTLDQKKRFEIMYKIESIVEKELPWVMLMYESTYMVQQEGVRNFRKSFFIRNHYKYIQN